MSVQSFRPIVFLDDDPDFVQFAARVIEDAGWHVETFTDARVAQEAFSSGLKPALLFVDLMMPHIDGEEFVAWFKRELDADVRGAPVIFLSAAWVLNDARERSGADAVLPKPFAIEELRDLCVRFARAHRLRTETDPPRMA